MEESGARGGLQNSKAFGRWNENPVILSDNLKPKANDIKQGT